MIRRSGQEVSTYLGEPPDATWIATTKWVGLTVFDDADICAALSG